MEPLTHTLVGAALARTPLGRVTPLAGAALVVGANLPDVDVASYVVGADAALGFRRGWTHGPLAMLLLPLAWTAVLLGWQRLRRRRDADVPRVRAAPLAGLSLLACFTHPALDWLNTYGVRLLSPIDGTWFYGDAVFIVDPWVWLLLGGGVFLSRPCARTGAGWISLALITTAAVLAGHARLPPAAPAVWLVGLAGIAIADRRRGSNVRWIAAGSLTLVVLYVAALVALSSAGESWARAELARRGVRDVARVMVGPLPANPTSWELVAETGAGYRRGAIDWRPGPRLRLESEPVPPLDRSDPRVRAALAAPSVAGAVGWMRFPHAEVRTLADGWEVVLIDVRYARSADDRFGVARVRLDRGLRPRD